jgi:hypothetical protein
MATVEATSDPESPRISCAGGRAVLRRGECCICEGLETFRVSGQNKAPPLWVHRRSSQKKAEKAEKKGAAPGYGSRGGRRGSFDTMAMACERHALWREEAPSMMP